MSITIKVNEKQYSVDATEDTPLLWVLRDHLKLTGTKYGCGIAQCGACTVLVDGNAIRSCITPISSVGDQSVTTIESSNNEVKQAVVGAWNKLDVVQCGYCQSGQIMSATALLSGNNKPSDEDIDAAMSGNICRCATYVRIRAAIKQAADSLGGQS